MFDRIRQMVFGSQNVVAAGNINFFNPHPIRFYEKDIKEIINCFSQEVEIITGIVDEYNDFYRPNIEKKNEINDLTSQYFEHIKNNSLVYFSKISEFLNDRRNKKFLEKYLSTAKEINNKIVSNRTVFR